MLPDLDAILRTADKPAFKSQGERRIAEFLDQCGVRYMYEAPVAVERMGKLRLQYPDFYAPDLGVYIEYFGAQSDPAYEHGITENMTAYSASGITVIPVYPCHLQHLPQYLTREIQEHANYQQHLANTMLSRSQAGYTSGGYRG